MRYFLPSLLIAGCISLAGCDSQSLSDAQNDVQTTPPSSRIAFNPTGGVISLPSDVLALTSKDGTLDIPVDDASNFADPAVALSALDGWGTNMPFVIDVDYAGASMGVSELNAATVAAPGAVLLYEVLLGSPLSSDADCRALASGLLCKVIKPLSFGVDYITQASSKGIAVVPLKPFKTETSYLVAVTRQVEDSAGRAVEPSETYILLQQDISTQPLGSASQLALQAAVNSYEAGLAAEGVDKSSLIYTMPFSTQSAGAVLSTVRLMIANMSPVLSGVTDTGQTAQQLLGLDIATPAGLAASAARVYRASLTLPYMSIYPHYDPLDSEKTTCSPAQLASQGSCDAINGFWTAEGDSPISVSGALTSGALSQEAFAAQALAQGVASDQLSNPTAWVGLDFNLTLADGSTAPVDPERHLTRYNPVPTIRSMRSVDVLITVPDESVLSAIRGEAVTKPATGWPTVMYVHGIGSLKETGLAAAGTMAVAGLATISIDLPLHGSRSWDAGDGGAYELTTTSASNGAEFANGSAAVYANFGSLLSVRDNLRQSVSDFLTLKASITYTAAADAAASRSPMFDPSNTYLMGLSLGGIVGHNVVAVGNQPLVNPATGEAFSLNPFEIKAAALASPAGGLAPVFAFSPTFGPTVAAGLQASDAFIAAAATAGNITPAQFSALAQTDPAAYQALVDAVYPTFQASFLFAAQQIVDSGDPINYALPLAELKTPLLLTEIVGDGQDNLSDQVVINSAAASGWPLSGTEPLIASLGLTSITESVANAEGVRGVSRFMYGHHSSLLSPTPQAGIAPDAALTGAATAEMQAQIASFFVGEGRAVQVANSAILAPAK